MSRLTVTEVRPNEHFRFMAWLICIIGALFYLYEYVLRILPSIMSADLMRAFDLSAYQFGNFSAYYYYAYTPLQLVIGILMDRYGPRRLLMLACLACTIGAFIFAHSHSLPLIKFSRFLIGFGSAFAFVGALKLASIWLPPNRFASVSGAVTALGMLGAVGGDNLLARFVIQHDWRLTVDLTVWAGIILTFLIVFIVHDKVKTSKSFYMPELNLKDLMAGVRQSLKNPYIWINGFIGFVLYLPVAAFAELWGIPYLSVSHGVNHVDAVHAVSLIFLGWAIGAPFNGWLSDFIKKRKLLLNIGSLGSILLFAIILYCPVALNIFSLYILLFLFGLFTSTQVVVFAISQEYSSRYIAATAVSLTNMIVMLGGAIFQPLIGYLLDKNWDGKILHGVHVYTPYNYQYALTTIVILLIVAAILSFILRDPKRLAADK